MDHFCQGGIAIIVTASSAKSSRTALKVINNKFVIGKEEYAPFAAEMHYFRVSKRYWSICFERIRKAGFRIISTAVPWNLHESRQGEFDFSGRTDPAKDLVVFLELSREFGFKIILKPGPWILAQWDNGGIPDFVFRHPETAAKDKNGEPLAAKADAGAIGGLTPSYLHTRFQILLRHYYSVFSDVVKNYIYPRGPVFLIEIDYEPSFCHNFDPYSGDYNEYVVRSLYPKFLETRHGTIEGLNKAYKVKFKEFSEAMPPTDFNASSPQEMVPHLDWISFREHLVNRYADSVAELLSGAEMSAMFSRACAWNGGYHFPDLADARSAPRTIFTTNITLDSSLNQVMDRARSISDGQDLGFISSFGVGHASPSPEVSEEFHPVTEGEVKRQLTAVLASGIKGMNFSMFVGRDHWYGAALSEVGTIGPSYEIIRRANFQLARIEFEKMQDFAWICLVRYRPYLRGLALGRRGPFPYLPDLAGHGFDNIGRELGRCGFDYRILELTVPEALGKYKALVVPLAEYMSAEAQTTLVELLNSGVGMVFYGLIPRYDDKMQSCDILARALGVRTTPDSRTCSLETSEGSFVTRVYGNIRLVPTRAKKLAKSGAKTFAVTGKTGQAVWHMLTFDPAPAGDPSHGQFFSSIWAAHKLAPLVSSTDRAVTVILHAHEKCGVLYIMENSRHISGGEDSSAEARPIIVRANLHAAGIKAKRLKLVDIFTEQEIVATQTALANGISLPIRPGDSYMFHISRG
ncbi:beta-galactosidase [Candidatus Zixiibacteriota bacterium]